MYIYLSIYIRFPGEYRMYLITIGDGIQDSSGLHLVSFRQTPLGYPMDFSIMVNYLHLSFPFEEQVLFDYQDNKQSGIPQKSDIGGYIPLGPCFNSKESYWILICEGEQRGQVWVVHWEVGLFPCHMTFLEWLKDWVENEGRTLQDRVRELPFSISKDKSTEEDGFPGHFRRRRRNAAIELRGTLEHFNHHHYYQ